MKNYTILYGSLSGHLHSRLFRQTMEQQGYQYCHNKPDFYIAHSGGWLFLPPLAPATVVILIAPSYRSSSTPLFKSFARRFAYDFRYTLFSRFGPQLCSQYLLSMYYAVRHFRYNTQMFWRFYHADIAPIIKRPNTLVIDPADPSWIDETTMKQAINYQRIRGGHEVCWHNPRECVKLINYILQRPQYPASGFKTKAPHEQRRAWHAAKKHHVKTESL